MVDEEYDISAEIVSRVNTLYNEIMHKLKGIPVTTNKKLASVYIDSPIGELCSVGVMDEAYKIVTSVSGWEEHTTYLISSKNNACIYYVDSIDECLEEVFRLVIYAAKQKPKTREVILDVNQTKEYYKIFEIINDVVGTEYTGWMRGTWPGVWGNGQFRIWFPHLAETKNGGLVPLSNGCLNTISDDWNQFVYDDMKKGDYEGARQYWDYDLIFAKEPNGGPFIFRGVYKRDAEACRLNHHVEKRIATRVKVIGSPADHIELLDKIEVGTSIYEEMVSRYGLDIPENWKGDVRPVFQKIFAPLIEGTNYYFTVNTTDTSSKILELRNKDNPTERLMGASGKRDMQINVFFKHEFYVEINRKIDLPENKRPYKTQDHVTIQLEKLWDIICVATGKIEYLSNLKK